MTPAEVKAALEEAEAELAAVYRKVWPLREAYAESFPPAYTEFIGTQLMAHLETAVAA